MLQPLIVGIAIALASIVIQVYAVVVMLRTLLSMIEKKSDTQKTIAFDFKVVSVSMMVLFFGHLFQVAIWAALFLLIGEFEDFATALYHSMVNFASLGYGDIVMSEHWRLLGAIEASVGVLMFGLTAGIMIAVMQNLFQHHGKDYLGHKIKSSKD